MIEIGNLNADHQFADGGINIRKILPLSEMNIRKVVSDFYTQNQFSFFISDRNFTQKHNKTLEVEVNFDDSQVRQPIVE